MPVSDVEKGKYREFLTQLLQLARPFDVDPEILVWHYTTGQGLLGILESKLLYATQVSCLNDSTEVRYGSKLFRTALQALVAKYSGDQIAEDFLSRAATYFAEDPEIPGNVGLGFFVSCFSQLKDDLSQWRAYAGGENGYAIGFRVRDIRASLGNNGFVKVNYDADLHQQLAGIVAEATVSFYREGLLSDSSRTASSWTPEFLEHWDGAITYLAPLIKDPGFESEKEFRIIHPFVSGDWDQLKIVQKATLMARHLPLQLGAAAGNIPISAVIIGPCRHKGVTRVSVNAALKKHGFKDVVVEFSRVPYQQT